MQIFLSSHILLFPSPFDYIPPLNYIMRVLEEIKKKDIVLDYDRYDFSSVKSGDRIIGQDKAMGLLRLGLSVERPGYNIFLSGDEGSGRPIMPQTRWLCPLCQTTSPTR